MDLEDPQADAGTRTPDPFITSEVLYQLSYVGEMSYKSTRLSARRNACRRASPRHLVKRRCGELRTRRESASAGPLGPPLVGAVSDSAREHGSRGPGRTNGVEHIGRRRIGLRRRPMSGGLFAFCRPFGGPFGSGFRGAFHRTFDRAFGCRPGFRFRFRFRFDRAFDGGSSSSRRAGAFFPGARFCFDGHECSLQCPGLRPQARHPRPFGSHVEPDAMFVPAADGPTRRARSGARATCSTG